MVHFDEELKKYMGIMNSFHAYIAVVTSAVARIGFISGIMIVKNIRAGEAPSMKAASSRSLGTFLINPDSVNIVQGSCRAASTAITPRLSLIHI